MREILISFLTPKGVKAYEAIEAAGKSENWKNRRIVNHMYVDSVVSRDPLVIKIDVKIPRLAIASELDKQIIKGLELKGAKLDEDFKLEVKYKT